MDNTADRVVCLLLVLRPRISKSPLSHNEDEHEIAGEADPTQSSEV